MPTTTNPVSALALEDPPSNYGFERLDQPHELGRRALIDWTAWILALASIGGLGTRLSLGSVKPVSILAVLGFTTGFLLVPWIARRSRSLEPAALILTALLFGLITSVGYLGGGLDAPILILLPVISAIAMPLLGRQRAWIATLLVAASLAIFGSLYLSGHSFPSPAHTEATHLIRALMLLLASLLVAAMVVLFDRQNRNLRAELRHQASRDPLTKLANRRQFAAALTYEWQRSCRDQSSLSLVLFDIDHFKLYNDSFGHQAGDLCLQVVADISQISIRRSTDLVARYGGEEFVAILPSTGYADALQVADALRSSVEQLDIASPSTGLGRVTLSAGVATSTETAKMTAEDLIEKADRALYQAKEEGRNRVVGWQQRTDSVASQ